MQVSGSTLIIILLVMKVKTARRLTRSTMKYHIPHIETKQWTTTIVGNIAIASSITVFFFVFAFLLLFLFDLVLIVALILASILHRQPSTFSRSQPLVA